MNLNIIPAQIIFTKAFQLRNSLVCDYVYVSSDKDENKIENKFRYLRVKNIEIEFLLAKFPFMNELKFKNTVKEICGKFDCEVCFVKMKDCCLFSFNHLYTYAKIRSGNIWNLRNCHSCLNTWAIKYYSNITDVSNISDIKDVSQDMYYDKIFYKNTESPFRFTQNVLNLNNIPYYLCVKYDIPCIGSVAFDTSYFETINVDKDDEFDGPICPSDISTEFNNFTAIETVEFSKIKHFVKDFSLTKANENDLLGKIRVMSYDIETYNPVVKLDPTDKNQPIIAIGFAVFKINDGKPIKRFCITSKDLNNIPADLPTEITKRGTLKIYDINDTGNDATTYIVAKDEKGILQTFIDYICKVRPYIITGFNNWSFDDKWIQRKCEMYNLDYDFIKALNYYNEPIGKFIQVNPKLDNEKIKKSDYYTWRQNFTTFHDCMIAAKKEDPKRFSERSRSNLDTMLATYNIRSPYNDINGVNIAEKDGHIAKTGLKIHVMFDYWKAGINIYDIVKYCCQDAWITGTFAIKRNMLGDLIEMSNITYTNFDDSLHKAVGIRVSNTISWYAYHENFALFDTPDQESRTYQLKSAIGHKFFDRRTLIGGAVKNKRNGREFFIQALDFSSMYPSQKEGSNVDTSSRVDNEIILNYDKFGLTLKNKYYLEDMYCDRWFYEFENDNQTFYVEQIFSEYKLDEKRIKQIKEEYKKFEHGNSRVYQGIRQQLLKTLSQLIHPFETYKTNEDGSLKFLNDKEREEYILELMTNAVKFPQTVTIPVFFCQSPKDPKTDLPVIHYSLKEKMLSDFRAKRSAVKKKMATTKSPTEKIQLSAKEKAIKVVMNSEYGQTGSDLFAHFDSDIGAAVTFASRHTIGELTTCLYAEHFYVDESYLQDENLKKLIDMDIATIEKIVYIPTFETTKEGSQRSEKTWERIKETCFKDGEFVKPSEEYNLIDWILPPRRLTIRDEYDRIKKEFLESDGNYHPTIYRITLPPSELVYQDTDSNYYTNESIIKRWPKINPDTINEIMQTLYIHNCLLARLIPDIIHRRPIGVGWEGAFVVARYLNKKKKYYGKKWQEHGMTSKIKMLRSSDYHLNVYERQHIIETNEKGVVVEYDWRNLPDDYENYLNTFDHGHFNTYNSTIPYKNGDFFKASNVGNSIDHLDFVINNGIKCTGVDLARREQYKFINYNNLLIYQNDLRYLPLDLANTDDSTFKTSLLEVDNFIGKGKQPLKDVVEKLLENFYNQVQKMLDDNFVGCYPLEFFVKQKAYKEDKATEMKNVVAKMNADLLDDNLERIRDKLKTLIPRHGERHGYICIDEFNKLGLAVPSDAVKDTAYSLDHMRLRFTTLENKTIEQDEILFKNLDYHYYFEKLAFVLCNYIIIEERPTISEYLDGTYEREHPEATEKDIKEAMDLEIKNVRESLERVYINKYFPKRRKNKVAVVSKFENVDIDEMINLENEIEAGNVGFNFKIPHVKATKEEINRWIINRPVFWATKLNNADALTRKILEQMNSSHIFYEKMTRLNVLYHNLALTINRENKIVMKKYLIKMTARDTNSKGTLVEIKFEDANAKPSNRAKVLPFYTKVIDEILFDSPESLRLFIGMYFDIVPQSKGFRIQYDDIEILTNFLNSILP